MKDKLFYKNYEIIANPYQIRDEKKWVAKIDILKHSGNQVTVTPFTGSKAYTTRDEAIKNSLIIGKKIIDGEMKNCSV